jgi:hypothetical protein
LEAGICFLAMGKKNTVNMLLSIRKPARICLGAYCGKKWLPSPGAVHLVRTTTAATSIAWIISSTVMSAAHAGLTAIRRCSTESGNAKFVGTCERWCGAARAGFGFCFTCAHAASNCVAGSLMAGSKFFLYCFHAVYAMSVAQQRVHGLLNKVLPWVCGQPVHGEGKSRKDFHAMTF